MALGVKLRGQKLVVLLLQLQLLRLALCQSNGGPAPAPVPVPLSPSPLPLLVDFDAYSLPDYKGTATGIELTGAPVSFAVFGPFGNNTIQSWTWSSIPPAGGSGLPGCYGGLCDGGFNLILNLGNGTASNANESQAVYLVVKCTGVVTSCIPPSI